MKIFIVTMDDPIYTIPFFKEIIEARYRDIIGVAVAEGNRLKIGNRSKIGYLISLLLIMGLINFVKHTFTTIWFKIKIRLSCIFNMIQSPSILNFANKYNISTYRINSPNDKKFLGMLKEHQPDIIINQSQHILKREFLCIPKIGVLNRHNALLPKNRGRLTPFWVLYKNEAETGVSIHFVTEGIDEGDIIVQERFQVTSADNFNTLVQKNYKIAAKAMLKAVSKLEKNYKDFINNDNDLVTYNTIPTFRQALKFRISRIKRIL